MAKRFITIAGNIGSGKTTLTNLLAERYGWDPHYEVVTDNPYLADFYRDMPRWALPLQVFFLSKRFQAHQKIVACDSSAIQDRSIYEDAHIFARALRESGDLDSRDYENYQELFSTMAAFLTPPDLVVYVRRSVPCLISRIEERGRDYEKAIPTAYLELLNRCYEDWIGSYQLGKVLTVEADNLELKWKKDDFDYLCSKMENSLEQPELFTSC
jgi:deoxyadenosine/deoxycytidine kinase